MSHPSQLDLDRGVTCTSDLIADASPLRKQCLTTAGNGRTASDAPDSELVSVVCS